MTERIGFGMKKFGFGLMRLPIVGKEYTKVDLEKFREMADSFIAAGGTYFDTAYPYHGGFSEQAFREVVVKRYPRDSFTITDKMPMYLVNKEENFQPIFEEQLQRCGVKYFDYYWLHALTVKDYPKVQQTKAFDFLIRKKAEGKIKHIGFSYHDTPELLERILTEHPEVEYVQLQLNYLDWEDPGVRAKECYEVATAHGKPVIVMEPIKGGVLANLPEEASTVLKQQNPDLSIASWAIRFAASPENVMMVLSGMGTTEQMEDNLSYMKDFQPLNDVELKTLEKATQIIRSGIAIPCTACRYCVSESKCPKDIMIPDYFAMYNDKKRYNSMTSGIYYNSLSSIHGKASECIGCGLCEKHCPQHLPIREYLKEVALIFEAK